MNDDQLAFLNTIAESPDADLPRLVYADWLDEHCDPGQPGWPRNELGYSARAEFIRVQVAFAALPLDAPSRDTYAARADELLAAHRAAWEAVLKDWFDDTLQDVGFNRGFVESVELDEHRLDILVEKGFPPLEPVIHCLDLFDDLIDDEEAIELANSPHLIKLRQLDLGDNEIGHVGVAAIAMSPFLANLEHLDLGGNDIGTDGAFALANSPHMASLRTLNLGLSNIGTVGVVAIANSPHMANLQHLDLGRNDIGADGAVALANSHYMSSLQSLNLLRNAIGAAGIQALADSRYLSERVKRTCLRELGVSAAQVNAMLSTGAQPGESPAGVGATAGTAAARPTATNGRE
jgi:uncharacterized protein (TIGR02996 family)